MRSACLAAGDLRLELHLDLGGQRLAVGDQHAGGHRVVLGLADQVGSDERGVGGVVGDDRDLGRAGLGIDADRALQVALGRSDVDVAGAGDEVDGAALPRAVREHRQRLGTTGGVDLVDAEQRAGGKDRRVRQSAELLLRRTGQRDAGDARDLRRHGVHDHSAHQRREAAGYVQADALHRHDASFDDRTRRQLARDGLLELCLAGLAEAAYGLLESSAYVGVQLGQRFCKCGGGHTQLGRVARRRTSRRHRAPRRRLAYGRLRRSGFTVASACSTSSAARGTAAR